MPEGIILEIERVFESHVPDGDGRDLWRAIIHIKSDFPDKNKLLKIYEVWATVEYLEDYAKYSNNGKGMARFAIDFLENRFKENNNELPEETGAFCAFGKCELGNRDGFPVKI